MRMLQHFRPLARSGLLIKDSAARHGPALLHTADGPASGSNAKEITIEPMANRELVRVRGDEVVTFLQGLITNDMNLLQSGQQPSIWTFFLNKAGRVLYDNIIFRTDQPSTYFIECDKAVTNDLCKLLRMYRVRRKIDIDSVEVEYRPWLAFSTNIAESIPMDQKIGENFFAAPDPRLKELGNRLIVPANKSFEDVAKSLSTYGEFTLNTDAHNYRNLRYRNGIAEGVEEIPPGKSFPLELNGDFLQGVSFNKGCYIGQELTARVAHTGVVRKRLMPLRLSAPIQGTDSKIQTKEGAAVGTIRGVDNDLALAVLRIEPAFSGVPLVVEGQPCYPEKPKWWPEILPERGTIVN